MKRPDKTDALGRPSHWPQAVYGHPLPQALRDIGAGLRPIPATEARWHHYVPKLTLRGFKCPDRGKHVVHLDKTSGKTRKVSIESASGEQRLYSARDDDGGYDNRIEGFLALVEGYAAPALRRLLERQATPSEDESMPIRRGRASHRARAALSAAA